MNICKLCTNFALPCTTYSDNDKHPLLGWDCRMIKGEHGSKSVTKFSTSGIKRADTGNLPSNGSFMIYGNCTELSESHSTLVK